MASTEGTDMKLMPLHEAQSETLAILISNLIESVGVVHAMHLTTREWVRHKALDEYYKDMPELIDALAESALAMEDFDIVPGIEFKYGTAEELLGTIFTKCHNIHSSLCPSVANPLEEVMTKINQVLYKLRFK